MVCTVEGIVTETRSVLANAFLPMVTTPEGRIIDSTFDCSKALSPIVVTVDANSTVSRSMHMKNAFSPITVAPSKTLTVSRSLFSKALAPITSRLEGSVISVILLLWNAFSPIDFRLGGNSMDFRFMHHTNALSPIDSTVVEKVIVFIVAHI